jgi:site-specific recombinase XerD
MYRSRRTGDQAAAKTQYTETVVIRQLINFALSRDLLAADPLKMLKLKKPRPTLQPCWSLQEVQSILTASPDDVKTAMTVLAETGMRFGEMAWLTWGDVDQTANVLRVQPKDG